MNPPVHATALREMRGGVQDQSARNLAAAACGGHAGANGTAASTDRPPKSARLEAVATILEDGTCPPVNSCNLRLKVAFFFDGTGNNLDADIGTNEHSNVARLSRSHPDTDAERGMYRHYVPGLGTYFPGIHDSGEDDLGGAFGKFGEERLEWAMHKLDEAVADHPLGNILGLDVALFGFSRGATLARAFARRLSERCPGRGAKRKWPQGGFETRLYFMGLFDTVASVGLPASASANSMAIAKQWVSLSSGLAARRASLSNGLRGVEPQTGAEFSIAFGAAPGADPTTGPTDGHAAWADNLHVPDMAERCLHYVAAHEIRNSFPLDSCRDKDFYPAGVLEFVYPGAHSDVGGGYRPGEGGKSEKRNELLGAIPLRAMHASAIEAGVPLGPTADPRSGSDFELSPMLWKCYLAYKACVEGHERGKTVEARFLAGMKLFNAWRLQRIFERGGSTRPDAARIGADEKRYAKEQADLDQQIAVAERDPQRLAVIQRRHDAEREATAARSELMATGRFGWGGPSGAEQVLRRDKLARTNLAQARSDFDKADDARAKLVARRNTLPASGLVGRLTAYDEELLRDIEAIKTFHKRHPDMPLRPHYANLIEVYTAQFDRRRGILADQPDVLAFFDNYVHDSLAAFAKDETLPSDPRVIYLGGDREARYAANPVPREAQEGVPA